MRTRFTAFAGAAGALRGCAVLTPHAGEFARVFGPIPAPTGWPPRAAPPRGPVRVVLLKGADTIIAAPDGRAAINDIGAALAGDRRRGGRARRARSRRCSAQGMPAWEAACAAAWLHGRAARLAGPGLIAEDLPPASRRER